MKLKGKKRAIAAAAIAAMKRKGTLWGRDSSGKRRKGVRSAGKEKAKISAKALKRKEFKPQARGGVIFSAKNSKRIAREMPKFIEAKKEHYTERAKKSGALTRESAAKVIREERKRTKEDFRTYEKEHIKTVTERAQYEKSKKDKWTKGFYKNNTKGLNESLAENKKNYQADLKKGLDRVRRERTSHYLTIKSATKVHLDMNFIKPLVDKKPGRKINR